MCYETKKRIADCVKELMRKKPIAKITISDVVSDANISRQSFYYHFKDIYEVLEWSYQYDFVDRFPQGGTMPLDQWMLEIYKLIDENRGYVYRIISEISWHTIVHHCAPALQENVKVLFLENEEISKSIPAERADSVAHFVATSCLYYIFDLIQSKKHIDPAVVAPVFRGFIFCVSANSLHFNDEMGELRRFVS